MTIFDILSLLLGISLFLFGMSMMADTLKKNAGSALVGFLKKMTSSRLKGLLFGMLLTAIIQSSSATTVMIVGFVNAGTLTLSRSVPIIMGCNVGTAITSWITALSGINALGSLGSMLLWLKPSSFTPILAFIGLLFYITAKKDKKRNIGMIFLGFSILMVGMDIMSDSVAGLKENQAFQSILLAFENPVYGWLAGLVMTAVLQSSSAAIGILQSLTVTGAVTFGNAVPIIMGAAGYDLLKSLSLFSSADIPFFLMGSAVAFVSAIVATVIASIVITAVIATIITAITTLSSEL